MSYHMKEAIEYDGTGFTMLYNKVQISRGDLLGPQAPEVTTEADAVLHFTWTDNSGQITAKPKDKLIVVVYEPTSHIHEVFHEAAER